MEASPEFSISSGRSKALANWSGHIDRGQSPYNENPERHKHFSLHLKLWSASRLSVDVQICNRAAFRTVPSSMIWQQQQLQLTLEEENVCTAITFLISGDTSWSNDCELTAIDRVSRNRIRDWSQTAKILHHPVNLNEGEKKVLERHLHAEMFIGFVGFVFIRKRSSARGLAILCTVGRGAWLRASCLTPRLPVHAVLDHAFCPHECRACCEHSTGAHHESY